MALRHYVLSIRSGETYSLVADGADLVMEGGEVTLDVVPAPPLDAGTITATAGDGSVTISEGTAPSGGSGSYTRDLYRSTTSGQKGSVLAADISLPYDDDTAENDTTYYYTLEVDDGSTTDDTPQVSATPEAAPETNEPAGYTQLFHIDGTSRDYGELATDDNIALVEDANAPNGSAIEWRWPVGSGPGHTALYNPSFGPVSEVYYRIVRAYNSNWQNHSGGDKLMYFGHVGKASSYFLQLRGGQDWGDGDYRVGFQNQAPNLGSPSFLWISDDPVLGEEAFAHTDGAYHVWEVQMVAQSEAGAADGIFRLWYDGDLKEERTDMQWVTAGDVRFQGCEYRPYWGGSGGETKQVSPYDWLRDGELYISGRP